MRALGACGASSILARKTKFIYLSNYKARTIPTLNPVGRVMKPRPSRFGIEGGLLPLNPTKFDLTSQYPSHRLNGRTAPVR